MSCSKPLPPFVCDSLYYLNRDRLERFSIVCRPMKNFIERYLHSKPYRVFNWLAIRGGLYMMEHNDVQWHPNRDDYSVQQFLDGQICDVNESENSWDDHTYYSFAEMLPYLGPTIRIKKTTIGAYGAFTYTSEHISEMESIAYLWRDHNLWIFNDDGRVVAEDFLPILNSPTILQCQKLCIDDAHFSFKDYKMLYQVKAVDMRYFGGVFTDINYCPAFLEQAEPTKPIVAFYFFDALRDNIVGLIHRLKQAFISATLPNAFKIVFIQFKEQVEESLAKFRETNKTTSETLELKKGLPVEYQEKWLDEFYHDFYGGYGHWSVELEIDTLVRSSI